MRIARMAVVALALTAGAAQAQGIKGTGKYGEAGCGLGSMAFGNQSGMVQVLAATTNGLFFTQTFGITSGTSNCDSSVRGQLGAKVFIEGNREALAKDAARGGGETIDTLTMLAGCKDARAVGATLQRRFTELFPSQSASDEQISSSVMGALRAEPSLACGTVG